MDQRSRVALQTKGMRNESHERSSTGDRLGGGDDFNRMPSMACGVRRSTVLARNFFSRALHKTTDHAAVEIVPLQAADELLGNSDSLRNGHDCAAKLIPPSFKGKSKHRLWVSAAEVSGLDGFGALGQNHRR